MKKIIYFSLLVAGVALTTSCNHEPDFQGLDVNKELGHIAKYTAVYSGAAFSADKPARDVLPEWLKGQYYSCDKGSTALVDYKYMPSVPEYVSAISSATSYTLSAADYKTVWGEASSVNYFSPSKPASKYLAGILKTSISEPANGAILAITYNQADKDGSEPAFTDNFESNTFNKWANVTTVGTYAWQLKVFSGNYYAQQSAFKHADGPLESYLITASPVSVKSNMVLSFDALYANFVATGGTLSVLISTDLKGVTKEDVQAATWDDITSNFTIPESASGSGDMVSTGEYPMDKYAGKKIYLAFKYTGDSKTVATTTARIDNVLIKNAVDEPVTYKEVYSLYKYSGEAWSVYPNVIMLQPADYNAMGIDVLTATAALSYLPAYLSLNYPYALSGDQKTVAYKSSGNSFMATEFAKGTAGWTYASEVTDMTDEYEFDGVKWNYVRTVPKAALNENFDSRTITDNDRTMLDGWLNVPVQGELYWIDKKFSGNNYTQCSAYGAKAGKVEVWFVTPKLEIKSNYSFTFDMVSGYWTHEALDVYISTDFSGKEDGIAAAKWTKITENFDFPKNETGYSKFTSVGSYKLDSYVGQNIYIAFKYLGDKDNGQTSTVQLDNIYVGE